MAVTEQSTGSLQLGLGYSSQSNLVGEFSYTEHNLFGRGQFLKAAVTISQITKEYTAAFTEPYFLDRPLAAGVQLFQAADRLPAGDLSERQHRRHRCR